MVSTKARAARREAATQEAAQTAEQAATEIAQATSSSEIQANQPHLSRKERRRQRSLFQVKLEKLLEAYRLNHCA
jgi:hypothetical protein